MDIVLNQDIDYCGTRTEPIVARVQLTPSLKRVFESLPPPSADFNIFSDSEVRKSMLASVRMELAELPKVHTADSNKIKDICRPKAPCVQLFYL